MKHQKQLKPDTTESQEVMAALVRAGEAARKIAIQTNTAIIIVKDGQLIRVTAEELRKQELQNQRD